MKVIHEGKSFILNPERAIELGVLKPEVAPQKIELSGDDAAVLYAILGRIGGDDRGARGVAGSIRERIYAAFPHLCCG
jgi:hypothetical protein